MVKTLIGETEGAARSCERNQAPCSNPPVPVPLHSTSKVLRDRDRLERIERGAHHRQLCSNADFFAMPDLELELDRARADAADHQAEAQDVADLARADEVAFHPAYRGADALFCD